jgi:alpha-mannosidase
VQSSGLNNAVPFRVVDDSTGRFLPDTVLSADNSTGVSELSIAVTVPALGYKLLTVFSPNMRALDVTVPVTSAQETADAVTLENGRLRIQVEKKTGCITNLVDTRSHFDAIAPGACGNRLQFFNDTPKEYDAWNIDPGTLDAEPSTIDKADSVELIDAKSTHPAIRITSHRQNSNFVQVITLAPDSDIVDIENDIDWHEAHVLLKAAFPVAAYGPVATYEIPYGTIDRPTTRNNSWEKAQFEVPAMRWADLSGTAGSNGVHGLSILNTSKYGYDAAGDTIRITLLRSPKWPDAEADMGHHHFHYALYPHAGTWREALTVRHGWEYNYPLTAVVTTAHPGSLPAEHSFASVSPEKSRRRQWFDLPRLRVGREAVDRRIPRPARSHRSDRHQHD